jgi:DNA mismatch repair ATPase MutS
MTFFTDIQTRQDLNLLDRYSNKSVYAIFNQVKTSGASRLLEKMFNNPFAGHEAINSRSAIFKFFATLDVEFPIDDEELLTVESYLESGGIGFMTSFTSTVRIAGLKILGVSEEYDLRIRQIQALFKFCGQTKKLISQILAAGDDNPLTKELRSAQDFLDKEVNADLLYNDQEIPLSRLIAHDRKFRVGANGKLLNLLDLVHHLDLYIAVSSVSRKNQFAYAQALPGNSHTLSIIDCRNPLVKYAKGNSIEISEHKNVIFLTGANMAGKSTLMKSVGIALYLAHMGFPVPADQMTFSVMDGLYTSINISDNLEQGYSHFYAEVKRVKDVAEAVASSKKLFVIFDELFKGTNVKDAYDATLAVTQAFAKYKQCGFIISTHIIEVTEELGAFKEDIQFCYLPTEMQDKKPVYTYKLQEGVSDDRHGMVLIRKEGILEMLAMECCETKNYSTI